jgi:hypothetical protein
LTVCVGILLLCITFLFLDQTRHVTYILYHLSITFVFLVYIMIY